MEQKKFQSTINRISSTEWLKSMPLAGANIGHFQILKRLGYGGMGCVFQVYVSKLEATRAIKILRPDSGKLFRERFSQEAKITANLDHSNIIRVFNVYKWKDGPFIEMEYIQGQSLDKLLKERGKLPLPVALSILLFVCKALDYAQKKVFTMEGKTVKGLIHRDLKPGNIMISKNGIVKLSDFGLAGFVSSEDRSLKIPMGSQAYIAPEGFQNTLPDMRSDIYSLGIVLYEMVCGERPFSHQCLTNGNGLQAKRTGQYPPIEAKMPGIIRSVPYIIDKCLQPDPQRRFQNFTQLNFECEAALEEITYTSPKEIVINYTKHPNNFKVKPSQKTKWYRNRLLIISFILVLFGIAMVIIGTRFKDKIFLTLAESLAPKISSEVSLAPEEKQKSPADQKAPLSSTNPGEKETIKPKGKTPPVREKPVSKPKPITTKLAKKDEKPVQTEKTEEISVLNPGIVSLQNARFDQAIQQFLDLQNNDLKSRTRDSLDLYLIEAYIKKQALREAHIYALKRVIPDGYYYLLTALLLEYAGNISEASEAFDKAVTFPSILGTAKKYEAMDKRIAFLFRLYERKKDSVLRIKTYNAGNEFLTKVCGQVQIPKMHCRKVQEIMKKLEAIDE